MKRRIKTYSTIMADPDWLYNKYGQAGHGAAKKHYPGTGVRAIMEIPVARWGRKDSNLLLWATLPKLDLAIDVMRAWGYKLVTSVPWVKTTPPAADIAKGIGFWFHQPCEILLVCRRGKTPAPKYRPMSMKPDALLVGVDKIRSVFYARRSAHSRKPLSLIEWIESYLPGPYLELYATGERAGWTCWGHKTGWHLDKRGVTRLQD